MQNGCRDDSRVPQKKALRDFRKDRLRENAKFQCRLHIILHLPKAYVPGLRLTFQLPIFKDSLSPQSAEFQHA